MTTTITVTVKNKFEKKFIKDLQKYMSYRLLIYYIIVKYILLKLSLKKFQISRTIYFGFSLIPVLIYQKTKNDLLKVHSLLEYLLLKNRYICND